MLGAQIVHLPFILATLSSPNVTFLSSKSVNVVKKNYFQSYDMNNHYQSAMNVTH